MSWLRKLWGLFIDDGHLALAIVVWLLLVWLALPLLRLGSGSNAVCWPAGNPR